MLKLKVRTIDNLGRIVLPKEFRQSQGWTDGTKVTVYQDHDTLIIKLSDAHGEPECEE